MSAYQEFVKAIKSAHAAFERGESLMARAAKIAAADNELAAVFAAGRTPAALRPLETKLKAAVAAAYGWDKAKTPANWRVFKGRIRRLMADPSALAKAAKVERKARSTKQAKDKAKATPKAKAKATPKAKGQAALATGRLQEAATGLLEVEALLIGLEETADAALATDLAGIRHKVEAIRHMIAG